MSSDQDIVQLEDVRQYLFRGETSGDKYDDVLGWLITAASQGIVSACGQRFLSKALVETRNGNGRQVLYSLVRPVATSPVPVVTENGVALVVGTGYSPGSDVVFNPDTGAFYRITGPTVYSVMSSGLQARWIQGVQNVTLSYTGGYTTATMPEDLKLLAKYLVAMMWKTMERKEIGVARKQFGQGSTEYMEDLPGLYQRILDVYSRPMVPES